VPIIAGDVLGVPIIVMTRRVVLTAAVLLAGAVAGVVANVACADGNSSVGPTTTHVSSTDDVIFDPGGIELDVQISSAQVGDEITVTGRGWTAIGPVRFYLLTEDQSKGPLDLGQAIRFGEAKPEEDGAVAFRFRLASSYETRGGERVRIEAGQKWLLWAYQQTETGSQGTRGGLITVK